MEHARPAAAAAVSLAGEADEWLQRVGGQAAAAGGLEAPGAGTGEVSSALLPPLLWVSS